MNKDLTTLGTETAHKCPMCPAKLRVTPGSSTRPEGFTLFCASPVCPAQEVTGYGKTVDAAFKVVTDRFNHRVE